MHKMIARLFCLLALMLAFAAPVSADDDRAYCQGLVEKSAAIVRMMRGSHDFAALNPLLEDCRGVIILPSVVKAGFIWGGQGGNGVMLVRDDAGTWSPPAFYTFGGGSFGLQIGAQEMSIVMTLMNDAAVNKAINGDLDLGVDANIAAGGEGARGEASTVTLPADLYYFADVGGLFAGVSLEGGVISRREGLNGDYYGQEYTPQQVLIERIPPVGDAQVLIDALTQ